MSTRNTIVVLLLSIMPFSPVMGSDFSEVISRAMPWSGSINRPITQAEVLSTSEAIANEDPLSPRQQLIVQNFTQMLRERLSPSGLATLEAVEASIHQDYEPGNSVNLLLGSILSASDSDMIQLEQEISEIVDKLPKGMSKGDKRRQATVAEPGQNLVFIWAWMAVAACDFAAVACLLDVEEMWEDCMMGEFCTEPRIASLRCCDNKAQGDLLNCVITCGANRADDDYNRCCR